MTTDELRSWATDFDKRGADLRRRIQTWPMLKCTQPTADAGTERAANYAPLAAGQSVGALPGASWRRCETCGRFFAAKPTDPILCECCRDKDRQAKTGRLHEVTCEDCGTVYAAGPNTPVDRVRVCPFCSDGHRRHVLKADEPERPPRAPQGRPKAPGVLRRFVVDECSGWAGEKCINHAGGRCYVMDGEPCRFFSETVLPIATSGQRARRVLNPGKDKFGKPIPGAKPHNDSAVVGAYIAICEAAKKSPKKSPDAPSDDEPTTPARLCPGPGLDPDADPDSEDGPRALPCPFGARLEPGEKFCPSCRLARRRETKKKAQRKWRRKSRLGTASV
jgi:hypothetical protein